MDVRSVLRTKRDGGELSDAQLEGFVRAYVAGEIEDYHAAALLASIFHHGMSDGELEAWTRAMLHSGTTLAFPNLPQPKVDKHSTGGVGDKVSIPLAPALAACGVAVPMISGRGLAHTGGTLDKLESIPGFRTRLTEDEIARALDHTGVAFGAQTESLVPADRKFYALRDATELVESIPLIASSILSKKLAEGLDALVLDVKFGSGAFLPDADRGRELARTMVRLARATDVPCSAWMTAMDRPLGRAVGHVVEIAESFECLAGEGPPDLRELVCTLGGDVLQLAGSVPSLDEGRRRIADALDSGRALGVLELVVTEQGGDPRVVRDRSLLPRAPDVDPYPAPTGGVLAFRDVRAVGLAVVELGGGRVRVTDEIDPAVGLVWHRVAGEEVRGGEVLCEIHHQGGRGLDAARARLVEALDIGAARELSPLVLERVGS